MTTTFASPASCTGNLCFARGGEAACGVTTQHNSNTYNDWFLERAFVLAPMQEFAGKFLLTMKDYPPSQSPGSFNLEKGQKQIEAGTRRSAFARLGRREHEGRLEANLALTAVTTAERSGVDCPARGRTG